MVCRLVASASLARNADCHPYQTYWNRICFFNKIPNPGILLTIRAREALLLGIMNSFNLLNANLLNANLLNSRNYEKGAKLQRGEKIFVQSQRAHGAMI